MARIVEVTTGSRLHFGLTSLGHGSGRQFGGVGVMLGTCGVTLRVVGAERFEADGKHRVRVSEFADLFSRQEPGGKSLRCRVEVVSAPAEHVGLGTGTQLGLAVAAGLAESCGIPWRDASALSRMTGRGKRSAIGTHGFLHGGLLVDAGKLPDQPIGELADRVDVPEAWRFVLIQHPDTKGLAGNDESLAIDALPPVPPEVTAQLECLIREEIVPATKAADWPAFSDAVYEYGRHAGECFAAVQGGPFANAEIESLVEHVRNLGYAGTGQSSWGPTVFAIAPDHAVANSLVEQLNEHPTFRQYACTVAAAANCGASVRVLP